MEPTGLQQHLWEKTSLQKLCQTCARLATYRATKPIILFVLLQLHGIDEQLVMERTGHRSLEGVRSYKRTSAEQQETVSDILSNAKKHCTQLSHPALTEISNTSTSVSSDSSCNISLPSYLASKTGFTFNSCNTVNISFNNYGHPDRSERPI